MSILARSTILRHRLGLRQFPTAGLFCAAASLLGLALALTQQPLPASDESPSRVQHVGPAGTVVAGPLDPSERALPEVLLREGEELVDVLGHFKLVGDRVVFVTTDGKRPLVALENLSLERVARTIAGNPEPMQWAASGTVTEYRGKNYLFLRRVALRNRLPGRSLPAAPSTSGPK